MNEFLLAVISFLVVLGPLILIHEFGHFIAARLVGITVLEFGLGFPPRLAKLFEQGGTIFTLNWLPIGGFVRPLGEDFVKPVGEEATEKERAAFEKYQQEIEALGKKRVKTKSLMEAGPWQRILFMIAGAVFNFIGAFVILVIVAMIGRPGPAVVTGAAPQSPAAVEKIIPGDVVVEINGKTIGSEKEARDILKASETSTVNLTVKRNDEIRQFTLNPATDRLASGAVLVVDTAPNSPAAEVLKSGDLIIKANAVTITSTAGLQKYVSEHAGEGITLTINREGEEKTVEIVPRVNPPANQGALGVSIIPVTFDPAFGLGFSDTTVPPAPLGLAISMGAQQTVDIMNQIVTAPIQIIRNRRPASDARPVSPVGIAQIGGQVLQQSVEARAPFPILNFAALISVALGITNLLPIPGLDGGRILFVLIELLRGKPMDPEREGMVHLVGLMLLLGLVAIFVVNDILNPIRLPIR